MSTTRTKTPYKLEVQSADGSQTGSVLNATITNDGVVDVDISGNLSVTGTTTYVETTNLKISDSILELNKDNSGGADEDAGLLVQRGSANNAAFYWNEGDDKFKAVLTTSEAGSTSITDSSTATIVANIEGTATGVNFDGIDITDNEISAKRSNDDLVLNASGTGSIVFNSTVNWVQIPSTEINFHQITIAGNELRTNDSNADLKISANTAGQIHFDDFTKFTNQGSNPTAVSGETHLYGKTQGGGGTGLFYVNTTSSGELVSKAKAQIFGLIF